MKVARTVWSRGKDRDNIKILPIAIRYNKCLIIEYSGKRGTVSTGILNGGYSENLKYIFNNDIKHSPGMGCILKGNSYEEHMEITAAELDIDSSASTGLGTAADMENASILTEIWGDLSVTAIVTAGIENNGGRAGDPASYAEENSNIEKLKPGTINILLSIDGNLSPGTLTRAIITATEAKTAALQELMAGSNYSSGLATGSGTDGIIVYCNLDTSRKYSNAGKHSKLGELIGVSVKKAVKNALNFQTGLNEQKQSNVFRRGKRYGITLENSWKIYSETSQIRITKLEFVDKIFKVSNCETLVVFTSLLLHLLDQYHWGLISEDSAKEASENLLKSMFPGIHFEDFHNDNILDWVPREIMAGLCELI